MSIPIKLLNQFCHNIIQFHEKVELKDANLIISELQSNSDAHEFWHVEDKGNKVYFLWRRKDWLVAVERREQAQKDRAVYMEAVDKRYQAYKQLCRQICYELLGESDAESADTIQVKRIAEKILAKKSKTAQALFDMDLSDLPELKAPHRMLDEDITL